MRGHTAQIDFYIFLATLFIHTFDAESDVMVERSKFPSATENDKRTVKMPVRCRDGGWWSLLEYTARFGDFKFHLQFGSFFDYFVFEIIVIILFQHIGIGADDVEFFGNFAAPLNLQLEASRLVS